jgi:putative lipoic acid-binding regulatory protein
MNESPLTFPCDYPVKVMGRSTAEFRSRMIEIMSAHGGPEVAESVTERESRGGNYLSLTCTVHAESREELDRLYRELHATGLVLYAL